MALGGITWLVASYVITIVTKGVTTLVAAAVLLYVGFWMDGGPVPNAGVPCSTVICRGPCRTTMWALALVSFLAVYREAFETVLFYQALWLKRHRSRPGAWWIDQR